MDLKEYKISLGKLSLNEQKLRDIYLRKLALGDKIFGPPTGYVSIDKPWLKYYSEDAIKKDFEPMSAYQLMEKRNYGYGNEIAIEYFGEKITYKKLLENIDLTAKGLLSLGVKKGEIVLMIMPNTPEAEYIFYALNKIGAVVDCVDPRVSFESIQEEINEFNVRFCFGIDVVYDKIKKISNDVKVISISPTDSMPLILKEIVKKKNKPILFDNRTIVWNEFISLGKKSRIKNVEAVYEPNQMASIVHTGGTTGTSKGVMLSNEQMNGLIYQMSYGYPEFKRKQRFVNFMPPFIALGLNNSTHLSACLGLHSFMIPSFEPEDMPNMLIKYKPNIFLCGPTHLALIMRSEEVNKADLSFLKIICSGGEKLPLNLQKNFQNFLRKHNSDANIWIGYGATETSAGIACMRDECFTFESVGVPYLKNNIAIYDLDTNEEVRGYDKNGEILINAPTIMMGYSGKNSNEMNDVISVDEFGKKWYHTGDIGRVSEDGLIYIDGRMKQIIMRKVFKIYPQSIEKIILDHPAVKSCSVVGVDDEDEFRIPVANIVLKAEFLNNKQIENAVIQYVDDRVSNELKEYATLAGYNFLEALPLTPIGKTDFKALEKFGIINGKKRLLKKNNFSVNEL